MSRETVAAAIAESPLFSRCTQAEAMHVAQAMVRLEVADGAVLVKEGDARVGEMNAMYVIVEGSVDVVIGSTSSVGGTVVQTLHTGEWFGMMSLLDDQPRSVTCRAKGRVVLGSLTRGAFRYLFQTDVSVAAKFQLAIAQQLACDLRRANVKLRENTAGSEFFTAEFGTVQDPKA